MGHTRLRSQRRVADCHLRVAPPTSPYAVNHWYPGHGRPVSLRGAASRVGPRVGPLASLVAAKHQKRAQARILTSSIRGKSVRFGRRAIAFPSPSRRNLHSDEIDGVETGYRSRSSALFNAQRWATREGDRRRFSNSSAKPSPVRREFAAMLGPRGGKTLRSPHTVQLSSGRKPRSRERNGVNPLRPERGAAR